MLKKTVCLILTAALLFLTGCASDKPSDLETKSLAEIREEKENVAELAKKFDNLDLSNTVFYVPEADKLGGFTIDQTATVEERNQVLFGAAERLVGETPKDDELRCYNATAFEWISYPESKNVPDEDDLSSIQYRTDKVIIGVEYWGGIYFYFIDYDDVPMTDMGNYLNIFQAPQVAKFDLMSGENADEVYELQGGEISVQEAAEFMQSWFEDFPFKVDGLRLVPRAASVHKLGEKCAITTMFYYEYNGVLLDHHHYATNLETDEYDYFKDRLTEDISMARNDQVDQLRYGKLGDFKPTDESYEEFISLESFLSMMSEKLTGNSKFAIDSVELLYGVERTYPEGFEALDVEEKKEAHLHPLGYRSRPIWVAYISHSGLQEAEQMCVWADAVTGELGLFWGGEESEH